VLAKVWGTSWEVLGKAKASFVVQGEGGQVAYRREGNVEEKGFGG